MITLNLKAESPELQAIKEFLQENGNEYLADKINNGVPVEKDGKRLINKKDLACFMKYACEEAKKLSAKGATSACVKDEIVFGWAMHYFEEDTIVGTLYNPDGTKYEEPKKTTPKTTCCVSNPTPPKPKEPTLFDLLSTETPKEQEKPQEEKPQELPQLKIKEEKQEQQIVIQDNKKIDLETGEVLEQYPSIDKHSMLILYDILGGELEVQ